MSKSPEPFTIQLGKVLDLSSAWFKMVCACCMPCDDTDSDWLDSDKDEVTELPGVEREHTNAGYRAGITTTKEQVLQAGFDAGYPDGAEIGLQAGELIGRLQGEGYKSLALEARESLCAEKLFSYDYYDKQAKPLFSGLHPLLKSWRDRISKLPNNQPAHQQQ